MDTSLYEKLKAYEKSGYYGFHMPGHKRNTKRFSNGLPYGIDITEIEGFDDLHHADGILKEAQERANRLYGADKTRFLVNGSTAGILSAVLGCTNRGDAVLVARNCHKSVYHAVDMNGLNPVYVYPAFDEHLQLNTEISVSAVKTALNEHSKIRAVILVSPTYDGVVSDIESIAKAVHEAGALLIVDEAHGAHFGLYPYFPESAVKEGADVVIHSLHKTLPALTQTALLHIKGERAPREKIFRYLDMLQSSSPSYILMAGIDVCIRMLETEKDRETLFAPYTAELEKTREKLKKLRHIRLESTERFDRSKLILSARGTNMSGRGLYKKLLEDYHIQLEMAAGSYALAMTSPGDTKEGFERLTEALFEIDSKTGRKMEEEKTSLGQAGFSYRYPKGETAYTCREAMERADGLKDAVSCKTWRDSEGYISAEYAYLYPPGIPLVVPGERITKEVVSAMEQYRHLGFSLEGPEKEGYMKVLNHG